MSPEVNLEDLKKKHDEAWAKLKQFIYETYEPRFYRHKVGRKLEYINGWKTIEERDAAEKTIQTLHGAWDLLMKEYWKATKEHLHLPRLYKETETPDGPRWIRESNEEQEAYERALKNGV